MKILYVNNTMNIGGIESFLMNILRNIDRKKYEIVFLTYNNETFDYEKEIEKLGSRILRISNPNKVSNLEHVKQLYKVIKEESPDVVHCHTHFNSGYVMLAASLAKIKIRICHSHSTYALLEKSITKKCKWMISKTMMKLFATDFIACSHEAGVALYGKNDFKKVTNGINMKDYQYDEKIRKEYRKTLHIKQTATVIGHVGRLDYPKNHAFLIKIYKEYLKKNPNSVLVLVGDGPLSQKIEEDIKKNHLQDHIKMLGSRNDVNKLLNVFDFLVFPSIYEGLPLSLVEVQANGIPCLISDSISKEIKLTECIEFLSLKKSAKVWATKLEKQSKKRIDTYEQMQNSEYSIKNTINELLKIYNR